MLNMFAAPEDPPEKLQTQYLFVDEAGDPVLFNAKSHVIVGNNGCSRHFILGKLEVDDPPVLAARLNQLRKELQADPYFAGVESFRPERKKTVRLFHAKDDVAEVRYRVFSLLREMGSALRFHAVVSDKVRIAEQEQAKHAAQQSTHTCGTFSPAQKGPQNNKAVSIGALPLSRREAEFCSQLIRLIITPVRTCQVVCILRLELSAIYIEGLLPINKRVCTWPDERGDYRTNVQVYFDGKPFCATV